MNIDEFRAALSTAIIERLGTIDPEAANDASLLKFGGLLRVLDAVDATARGTNNKAYQFFILGSL